LQLLLDCLPVAIRAFLTDTGVAANAPLQHRLKTFREHLRQSMQASVQDYAQKKGLQLFAVGGDTDAQLANKVIHFCMVSDPLKQGYARHAAACIRRVRVLPPDAPLCNRALPRLLDFVTKLFDPTTHKVAVEGLRAPPKEARVLELEPHRVRAVLCAAIHAACPFVHQCIGGAHAC
jgi:hypothetical protein